MESPPFPHYLVPPRSKYSLQHHILKHSQPPFLPQCQRPSFTPIQNNWQNYSYINTLFEQNAKWIVLTATTVLKMVNVWHSVKVTRYNVRCSLDSVHCDVNRRYKCHDYALRNGQQFILKCISDDVIRTVQPKDRQILYRKLVYGSFQANTTHSYHIPSTGLQLAHPHIWGPM